MPPGGDPSTEARRLEELWAGDFGDAYTDRNALAETGRGEFWRALLAGIEVETVLEVGCNIGANLRWLTELLGPANVTGVDVNERALARVRAAFPAARAVRASATSLPFADKSFDLVFTTGVLIHLPDETLQSAMVEIVRCSRRYVLCGEYFADPPTELPYRGKKGALFKRDYGGLYNALFPELALRSTGFLGRDTGWDDVTWWLFERQ